MEPKKGLRELLHRLGFNPVGNSQHWVNSENNVSLVISDYSSESDITGMLLKIGADIKSAEIRAALKITQ
jgi:hypothetical protein